MAIKILDIFSGCGGSSQGAQRAGASIIAGIDMCSIASAAYKANFPGAKVFKRKVEDIRFYRLREQIGSINMLLASPECTNHSCAKGARPRNESSRATAMQIYRFARALQPRWLVMENVVTMRPWHRYSELLEKLRALGYDLREQVIDAADHGVPQNRRRLFVLGDCKKHVNPVRSRTRKIRTVWDILDPSDMWPTTPLFSSKRAEATMLRAENAIKALGKKEPFIIVYYGSDGSGGWQELDRPLRTVTTVDRFAFITPSRSGHRMRMLQVSELHRAMGFNRGYSFPPSTRRNNVHLLGNSVCPPVMAAVYNSLTGT